MTKNICVVVGGKTIQAVPSSKADGNAENCMEEVPAGKSSAKY